MHGFFESTPPPSVKVSSRHLFVSPVRSVDMTLYCWNAADVYCGRFTLLE